MSHRNIHQTLHLLYTLWTFLAPKWPESIRILNLSRYFKHTLNMNLKMSAWKRMEQGISLGSHRFLEKLNLWIVYRTVSSSNSIDILPQRWTFRRFPQQLIVRHSLVTKLFSGSYCLWHLPGFARAAFLITHLQSPNGRSQWPHSEPLPSRPVERDVRVHHRI